MRLLRFLSLALVALATLPGLCRAQGVFWTPAALPVLLGQETSNAAPSAFTGQSSFNDSAVIRSTGLQPAVAVEWTAPAPTPAHCCQDWTELFQVVFGAASAADAPTACNRSECPVRRVVRTFVLPRINLEIG